MSSPHPPVVFLHPGIVVDGARSVRVGIVQPVTGNVDMTQRPAQAINHLCERLGAVIVCTASRAPYDARDQLLMDGVRGRFASDWRTDWTMADRAAAIVAWHQAHGSPRAVVIERPGVDVPRMAGISVPDRSTLTVAAVQQLLAVVPDA